MLLVFDIGNTNICVGCFRGQELLFDMRLKTDTSRPIDEYIALLDALFERKLGDSYKFSGCIISSVVPPITPDFAKLAKEMVGVEALIVGAATKTGVALNVKEPTAVGADRIVNAVALKHLYGNPGVVVDFGTATTFDIVGSEGAFEGGIICPGMVGAMDSLVKKTAKLPRIELAWPDSVLGKTTVGAMQAGAVVGYVCMVDGLLEKISQEIGSLKYVVATGGLGRLAAENSKRITTYDSSLTLKGLRIIAEMNGIA